MKNFFLKDRSWFVMGPFVIILSFLISSPFLWEKNETTINEFFLQQKNKYENYCSHYIEWKWDKLDRLRICARSHTFGYMYVPRNKWYCPVCMSHSNLDLITPDFVFDWLKGVL